MDEGTPERALGNYLMDQPPGDLFRLVPDEIDGIADHSALKDAIEELVSRGYVEITRNPLESTYVKPTSLGREVFWG